MKPRYAAHLALVVILLTTSSSIRSLRADLTANNYIAKASLLAAGATLLSDNFEGENGGVGQTISQPLQIGTLQGTVDLIGIDFINLLPGTGLMLISIAARVCPARVSLVSIGNHHAQMEETSLR